MISLSTGFRNALAVTGSIAATLEGGGTPTFKINVYDGTPPATADAALSGNTLLLTIEDNDGPNGLTLEGTSTNGAVAKTAAQTWSGTSAAAGTPSFFRIYRTGEDPSTLSTTLVRMQGSCSSFGADLNLGVSPLAISTLYTIGAFEIRAPQ